MIKFIASIIAVSAVGLAGCATTGTGDNSGTGKSASASSKDEKEYLVGSRLPRHATTEKLVKQVGSGEYREDTEHKSIANSVGKGAN